MDKSQIKTMNLFGFAVEELPGKTVSKMTYYKRETNGEVVEMPGLPADSYHMTRYLKRGFVLERPSEPPHTEPQKASSVEFVCETCGKVLSSRIGLAGHNRSHKKLVEVT